MAETQSVRALDMTYVLVLITLWHQINVLWCAVAVAICTYFVTRFSILAQLCKNTYITYIKAEEAQSQSVPFFR